MKNLLQKEAVVAVVDVVVDAEVGCAAYGVPTTLKKQRASCFHQRHVEVATLSALMDARGRPWEGLGLFRRLVLKRVWFMVSGSSGLRSGAHPLQHGT